MTTPSGKAGSATEALRDAARAALRRAARRPFLQLLPRVPLDGQLHTLPLVTWEPEGGGARGVEEGAPPPFVVASCAPDQTPWVEVLRPAVAHLATLAATPLPLDRAVPPARGGGRRQWVLLDASADGGGGGGLGLSGRALLEYDAPSGDVRVLRLALPAPLPTTPTPPTADLPAAKLGSLPNKAIRSVLYFEMRC